MKHKFHSLTFTAEPRSASALELVTLVQYQQYAMAFSVSKATVLDHNYI